MLGFLLYCYFGRYFPGSLSHRGYEIDRIVGHMYMTLEGIFGVPISVSVSFVLLFVVYGTFMDVAGAGNFWMDMSLATMGRTSASAGRGALITTALLGGPQASGVATTISVTPIIWPNPLLKLQPGRFRFFQALGLCKKYPPASSPAPSGREA